MNYMVVLFKNKVRKKIINKFVTLDKAEEFFNKKIEENKDLNFSPEIKHKITTYLKRAKQGNYNLENYKNDEKIIAILKIKMMII